MTDLYAIFHLNLSFSLIDEEEVASVIRRCYWPLLKIIKKSKRLKVALEFSGNTLEKISQTDPPLIDEIVALVESGRLDIIASGKEQIVSPLVPYQVTLENLKLGQSIYKNILGFSPEIAYINEQVYSDGLIDLYNSVGFKAIIVDWDNISPKETKNNTLYAPATIKSQSGTEIIAIFISSVAMQYFRNYIFNQISLSQYKKYLRRTLKDNSLSFFPIYGDDLEIYDFKPHSLNFELTKNTGDDFRKIGKFLNNLVKDYKFILPTSILSKNISSELASITDSPNTIITKKKEKYNEIRWAVSGIKNAESNKQCFRLHNNIRLIENLSSKNKTILNKKLFGLKKNLVDYWASDLRTHTTEKKRLKFQNKLGWSIGESEKLLESVLVKYRTQKSDFVLTNPNVKDWNGEIFETKVHFAPKKAYGRIELKINNKKVTCQQEEETYYQDGSIQSAILVFKPEIQAKRTVNGMFIFKAKQRKNSYVKTNRTNTKNVSAKYWNQKGGVFQSLIYPSIHKNPLCGSILQGYYKKPKLSTDWFTSHSIIRLNDDSTIADLGNTTLYTPNNSHYPIRVPVYSTINMGQGEVVKKYYVYKDEPRVDVEKRFMFWHLYPKSFRIFNLTLMPESFDTKTLYLSTVNGGIDSEIFSLNSSAVLQDEAINLKVSSHGCQGATEGWVAIGDKDKVLAVSYNISKNYAVPLIHYERLNDTFFARIALSVAESDESAAHFYHGKFSFRNSILAANSLTEITRKSYFINNPLIFFQQKG